MSDLEKRLRKYRPEWDWGAMQGSRLCLKWNLQDLLTLDYVLARTRGRKAVVQAGGNLGIFPKRLAEEFAAVYTFEPDRELFGCLEHNAPEPNIIPVNAALGCSREPVALDCRRRDGSGRPVHEGLTHISGPGKIPQVLVDDLQLEACNLIYLDIEGYELNALKGAENTINRHHPVLALESNGNIGYYEATRKQLAQWVGAHGYRKLIRMHGDDVYVYAH